MYEGQSENVLPTVSRPQCNELGRLRSTMLSLIVDDTPISDAAPSEKLKVIRLMTASAENWASRGSRQKGVTHRPVEDTPKFSTRHKRNKPRVALELETDDLIAAFSTAIFPETQSPVHSYNRTIPRYAYLRLLFLRTGLSSPSLSIKCTAVSSKSLIDVCKWASSATYLLWLDIVARAIHNTLTPVDHPSKAAKTLGNSFVRWKRKAITSSQHSMKIVNPSLVDVPTTETKQFYHLNSLQAPVGGVLDNSTLSETVCIWSAKETDELGEVFESGYRVAWMTHRSLAKKKESSPVF